MEQNNQILIDEMSAYRGQVDMGLHGEGAKQFYACLLDLFETAGVENFVGVEITYKNEGFVINIERRGAADSIVAKMQRYEDAIGYAQTSLVVCRDLLQDDGSVDEVIGLLTKAMTEIDRLIEPRNTT